MGKMIGDKMMGVVMFIELLGFFEFIEFVGLFESPGSVEFWSRTVIRL